MSLTKTQYDKIKDCLKAFEDIFGKVRIERGYSGIYVFYPADAKHYTHLCPNVDYLKGWLFGCIQVGMGIVKGE